tara:strand:+ start:2205 stop:2489 length:285 start_codon:yes stop_codon:yes gene_type:complete
MRKIVTGEIGLRLHIIHSPISNLDFSIAHSHQPSLFSESAFGNSSRLTLYEAETKIFRKQSDYASESYTKLSNTIESEGFSKLDKTKQNITDPY